MAFQVDIVHFTHLAQRNVVVETELHMPENIESHAYVPVEEGMFEFAILAESFLVEKPVPLRTRGQIDDKILLQLPIVAEVDRNNKHVHLFVFISARSGFVFKVILIIEHRSIDTQIGEWNLGLYLQANEPPYPIVGREEFLAGTETTDINTCLNAPLPGFYTTDHRNRRLGLGGTDNRQLAIGNYK